MTQRLTPLALAAVFGVAGAAGCPPLPPLDAPPEATTVSTTETDEAADPSPTEAASAPPCTLPIAVDALEWRVNYVLPPSDTAWMRVWTTGRFDNGQIATRYERRDERGRALGEATYRCDAGGVWLERTSDADATLVFDPALPVWPATFGEGDASGVALRTESGSDDAVALRYEYAWDAAGGAPPLPFAGRGGAWLDLRYALVLTDGEQPASWLGESTWGVLDGVLFAAHRRVETSEGAGEAELVEEARVLHAPARAQEPEPSSADGSGGPARR